MKRLSWGILSTSRFAARAVIPATQKSRYSQVTAIASREVERASKLAAQLGIPKTFGSYESLLSDPDIDVIYNPLPNHLHVDWTLRALEAGKHVLCEKPIGLDHADALRLANAAKNYPGLKVMEAFMYRHHPQWRKVKELVEAEMIGEMKGVHSLYSYYNDDPTNIRNIPEYGGGGMLDIGCYCVSLSRFVYAREPERVVARLEIDSGTGVDRLATGTLDFGSGIATFTCGTRIQPYQRVNIIGTKGRIEIEIPFNAPNDRATRIFLQKGGATEEISFEACDQYTVQADLFAEAILNDTPVPTPISDAVSNMRVIDAVFESSRRREWVEMADHS